MAHMYETPPVHGVEKVGALFRGLCGGSIAVQITMTGDGGEVTSTLFFPPSAEAEARRVAAALNGEAAPVATPDSHLRDAVSWMRSAQKAYPRSVGADALQAVKTAEANVDALLARMAP